MEIAINNVKEIEVTAVYFRYNKATKKIESYPRRVMIGEHEYTF